MFDNEEKMNNIMITSDVIYFGKMKNDTKENCKK